MGGGVYVQATMVLANGTDLNGNSAALGGGMFWDVISIDLSSILGLEDDTVASLLAGPGLDLRNPILCADVLDLTA